MAGYVIGTGLVVFALWRWWAGRVPSDAVRVPGTVVEEVSRRSTQTGRRTIMHAPRVAYRHPRSGAEAVYEPTAFGQRRFAAGQPVELVYDARRDVVRLPEQERGRVTVVVAVGVGFLLAQWVANR